MTEMGVWGGSGTKWGPESYAFCQDIFKDKATSAWVALCALMHGLYRQVGIFTTLMKIEQDFRVWKYELHHQIC